MVAFPFHNACDLPDSLKNLLPTGITWLVLPTTSNKQMAILCLTSINLQKLIKL